MGFLERNSEKLVRTPGWMVRLKEEHHLESRADVQHAGELLFLKGFLWRVNNTGPEGQRRISYLLPICVTRWVCGVTFKIALSFPLSCLQLKGGLSEHETLTGRPPGAERKKC